MPSPSDVKIRISAQDKTRQAFKSVNRNLGVLSTGFKAFSVAAAGIFAGKFVSSVRSAAASLGQISDQADKLGLTTDSLQELRFAAEQAGVKVKSFDVGFQRFTRRAADAAAGNKALAKTFADFNIELTNQDGRLKSNEALFLEFADAIKASDDQGKRILKTFQLFDTEGVDLVRLLQQGSGAINEFRDRAREMGAVIDESLIRKSDEADKQLAALSRVIGANLKPALAALAPVLVSVAESFASAAHWVAQFFDRFRDASNKTSLDGIRDRMKEIRDEIAAFPNTPPSMFQIGELEDLSRRYDELTSKISKPLEDFGGLSGASGAESLKSAAQEVTDEWDIAFSKIDAEFKALDDEWADGFLGLNVAKEQVKELSPEIERVTDGARDLGLTMSSAFEQAVIDGENLQEVLKGILKDIAQIFLRQTVTNPLAGAVTSGVSSLFPGFAGGTDFAPGGLAVVGERGPEVVNLPRGSQVIPNHEISGMGGTTINVDARGSTDPIETERSVRRAVEQAIDTMRDMKVRGALPEFA